MGRSLLRALPRYPQLQLHAALVGSHSAALGQDSGELAGAARSGIALTSGLESALNPVKVALAKTYSQNGKYPAKRDGLTMRAISGTYCEVLGALLRTDCYSESGVRVATSPNSSAPR